MPVIKARVGSSWVDLVGGSNNVWDTAWGIVAMGAFIPPFAPHLVTAVETITYPATATLVLGRRYRVYFQVRAVQPTGGAGNISFWLRDNGVETRGHPYGGDPYIYSAGAYTVGAFEWLINGDNASHTIEIKAGPSGSHNVYTDYGLFYIEDVGPISAPPPTIPTPAPSWTPVTFQNGWGNYGSGFTGAQYRKIGDEVSIRGLVVGGTLNAAVFTLPVGFRPPGTEIFTSDMASLIHCRVDVNSSGTLILAAGAGGSNGYVSISGITFSTTA